MTFSGVSGNSPDGQEGQTLRHYGAYYVPAVEEQYLTGAFCMAQLYKALFLLTKETEPAVKNAQVAQAVSYIERSLGRRELSNELLASALHMSTASFRKQFTQAMGVSPMRYVLIRRMEYAKQLLQEGGCTVGQAAEQCGFANIYYFSNVFKSHTGVAPSQYAKRFTQI